MAHVRAKEMKNNCSLQLVNSDRSQGMNRCRTLCSLTREADIRFRHHTNLRIELSMRGMLE